jgi:hypothetical protein
LALFREDEPVLVQNCTMARVRNGFQVTGLNVATSAATPCRRVVIRDNRIEDCNVGIWAAGRINEAHIVANLLGDCSDASIRLSDVREGSGRIVVANNSITGFHHCLHLTGPMRGVMDVEIRNNVFVAEAGLDVIRDGGEAGIPARWRIDHNWRQVRPPAADSPEAKDWLQSAQDTVAEKLPLLALDPKHSDFLRPIKDSPLGTAGVGGDLPNYVGAVPPEGAKPWDWTKTWKARAGTLDEPKGNAGKNSPKPGDQGG